MQALWMVLAAFLFASMGVCVKMASEHFNAAELVCYRGIIGMAILWALARRQGVGLGTRYPGMHAWRSLIGVVSLGAWFYAIAHLPLATAMTLNYMSSVWIAAFIVGGALLAWRPSGGTGGTRPPLQAPLVMTVMAGFAGVVMMLRPSLDAHQMFAGLIGLLSGLSAAFAYMQVMALSRIGEPETRTVFYFAVGSAVAGGAAMLLTGASAWPGWPGLWLLPIGFPGRRRPALHDARLRAGGLRSAAPWWSPTCSIPASCSRGCTAWCCSATTFRPSAGPAWH